MMMRIRVPIPMYMPLAFLGLATGTGLPSNHGEKRDPGAARSQSSLPAGRPIDSTSRPCAGSAHVSVFRRPRLKPRYGRLILRCVQPTCPLFDVQG